MQPTVVSKQKVKSAQKPPKAMVGTAMRGVTAKILCTVGRETTV